MSSLARRGFAVCLLLTLFVATSAWAEEGKRYVIIHADDAGMSNSVNRGTIDAMERGIVSSASIMVPCPWFPEFAAYARKNPDRDYGIHLTLCSEWELYRWPPVAPREKVPSLVDEDGFLWDNNQLVAANAKAEEVEIELRAQIDRALQFGVPLTHLDTHMGSCFTRPDLAKVYVKLGLEYDLPVLFVRPNDTNGLAQRYPDIMPMLSYLEQHKVPILDELYQFYERGSYEERKGWYLDALRNAPVGVSEIIIHCGYDNEELQAITSSNTIRDTDRAIFMDPEVIRAIEDLDIEVITWRQFREMVSETAESSAE